MAAFAACCLISGALWAQIDDVEVLPDGARPVSDAVSAPEELYFGKIKTYIAQFAPNIRALRITLPDTVVPEGADTRKQDQEGGFSLTKDIGYIERVQEGMFETAPWYKLDDGSRIKKIEMYSKNATALRAVLTDLGPDIELRVYDPKTGVAWGPYAAPRLNEDGTWWSTIIYGDMIGLEFRLLPDRTFPPRLFPQIVGMYYHYADYQGLVSDIHPQGAACLVDVMCTAWPNTIANRSIAMLTGTTGCTGAMINRSPQDFAPILMTARHCITTQAEANGVIAHFFNQNQTCNGNNAPNLNTLPRNDGALLLKVDLASEWTLLGLYEPPGSNNFIGWDANTLANGSFVNCISHPGLRPKRFSSGSKVGNSSCLGGSSHYFTWSTGRIEPGSSGSPVFDNSERARGTASCASDTNGDGIAGPCAPDGWYGRFDVAFNDLQFYLFNMANPAFANRNVAGDPANDGSSERGTAGNPFNTVYEATFCVPTSGTVRITAGSYNERFRLWRAMTLETTGGVVRIGAP